MRAIERLAVDALGGVFRAVVVRGEKGAVVAAGDGGGSELCDAGRQGVGGECLAERLRGEAVAVLAVGGRHGVAELHEALVHVVRDRQALAGLVAHGSRPDRVEDDEVGVLPVDALAVGAEEGPHSLHLALLGAGEQEPDVEVLRCLGIELLGQREGGGHARGVVVGAGDDIGELDVREEEHADQQDQRRDQLEEGDQAGVDAGHPGAEDREEDRERPEEDAERRDGEGEALGQPRGPRDALGLEDAARPGGVVVGADEEAGGRLGPLAGRDDVLGRPAEEQPAGEVETAVQVEVHRESRDQHHREADGRGEDGDEAAGEAEGAVQRLDEPVLRVHVDGLHHDAAAAIADALREPVGGTALGVGTGAPALERTELVDDFHAGGGVHERGIIAGRSDQPGRLALFSRI